MPNGKSHIIAGAVCGALVSTAIQEQLGSHEGIEFKQLFLSTGTGALCGRLPDVLEPPIHPNHRDFFHSITFAAILGFGGVELWRKIKQRNDQRQRLDIHAVDGTDVLLILGLVVILVIVLHLLMDSLTKKGLPVI